MDLKDIVLGLDALVVDARDLDGAADIRISDMAYDSRQVRPGGLFFCIVGEKQDGHDHAASAAKNGAVALVVERRVSVSLPQLVVSDGRLALALAARNFYADPAAALSISAITGTNGKTTTTYLVDWICKCALAQARGLSVEEAGGLTGLIGTVETRVGKERLKSTHTTPESLNLQALLAQMRDKGIEYVSMEVSSHAIELKRVASVNFAVAAFSNLTQDHLDFHGTMESYFEAKAALFDSAQVAKRVINIDDGYGRRLLGRMRELGLAATSCGLSAEADVRAKDISYASDSTAFTLVTAAGEWPCHYPLIGAFNVSNVLLAATIAHELGFSWPDIVAALAQSPQIPGRLERVPAEDIGVFVDYSHTPDSIAKAIMALREISTGRIIIVFGCGGDRDRGKRPLMAKAAQAADLAVITSDNPRSEDPQKIIDDILTGMVGASVPYVVLAERDLAIAHAIRAAEPGDCVLIAGKGHEDYQLVGDKVLSFDDRLVAAEKLRELA